MTTYEQLYALSSPHVKAYRDDLEKWDKQMVEHDPTCPFLHYTRASGTHMIVMPAADSPDYPREGEFIPYLFGCADRWHILKGVQQMAEYHADSRNGTYAIVIHYDGLHFREIDAAKALKIAREYCLAVDVAWRRVFLRKAVVA